MVRKLKASGQRTCGVEITARYTLPPDFVVLIPHLASALQECIPSPLSPTCDLLLPDVACALSLTSLPWCLTAFILVLPIPS